MTSTPGPLTYERNVLRRILDRLMDEESNLETLCKHGPRLASTAANVARIESTLDSGQGKDEIQALREALRELESEESNEEEPQW